MAVVRLGIGSGERTVEFEADDPTELKDRITEAIKDGSGILWFKDAEGQDIGVPVDKIAYVSIEQIAELTVGFGT